jgi:putative ATPase
LRNSDVDAALYWLARLIEVAPIPFYRPPPVHPGVRRHRLADPRRWSSAAAADINQLIGLPEALFPLAQATIHLARAQSNAILRSYSAAVKDATETAREPVPLHLRNAPTP